MKNDIIVVVGFERTSKHSIGYQSFKDEETEQLNKETRASAFIIQLLHKGADVISIRRVINE